MNELTNLSNALEQTIKDKDLQDVTVDLAETFSDSFLSDGILKDIPILGTVVGLTKSVISLRDRLFLKKLIYFLTNLKDIPQSSRQLMISKIDSSNEYQIKVGEKLLYILEKCEDHKSAERIGNLFSAFLEESISYSDFLRAASIIDKTFSEDIDRFQKESYENLLKVDRYSDDPLSEFQHRLVSVGILCSSIDPISVEDQDDYKMSDKYVVRGGKSSVYLTEIGDLLRIYL